MGISNAQSQSPPTSRHLPRIAIPVCLVLLLVIGFCTRLSPEPTSAFTKQQAKAAPVPPPLPSDYDLIAHKKTEQLQSHRPASYAADANKSLNPIAVVIETKPPPNTIPLMLHFSSVLGPNWRTILYTLEENWTEPKSLSFRRAMRDGRVEIRYLPKGTELSNSKQVSTFLTSPWLWEGLAAESSRVMLFQTDSIICSRAEVSADDFLEWDLVGAPIDAQYGVGYNGGLSIRNPELLLDIIKSSNFSTSGEDFEDQWIFKQFQARGAKLPDQEASKKFSVETVYYETPLGYHQPERWQKDRMPEIEAWCPEVKMLIGRRAQ